MSILQLKDCAITGKRVLIRVDFNVPMENGNITDDTRIRASLPGILYAIQHNAKVILMSHFGRPTEGQFEQEYSLEPLAKHLSQLINRPVQFVSDWSKGVSLENGQVALLENVRFLPGESKNNDDLAKRFASLCDVFVMDAFASAHRAHASTHGVAKYAAIACAGPLMSQEVSALESVMASPKHPMLTIVGGSKVSTKLDVLTSLVKISDQLIVGGGIANTFLAAAGYNIGKSLYEKDLVNQAKEIMVTAKQRGAEIPLPTDVVVAKELSATATSTLRSVNDVRDDEMILDIGPNSTQYLSTLLQKANTILWNGPLGVFEIDAFANGTKGIALAVAESQAFSVAGGGDTIAAISKFGITDKISYISTAGGAFLEFIEGKVLPGVAILQQRAANS